jgi:hypothetical protein
MAKNLEDINQDILDIFEEANTVSYNNVEYPKREKHLKKDQDLGILSSGNFILIEDDYESEANF